MLRSSTSVLSLTLALMLLGATPTFSAQSSAAAAGVP